MSDGLFLNKDVSKIIGLTQRQVLSWTEKGLVKPEKPAKKAGTRRGYNYINLLEFGLAKYLLNVIGVQFFTALTILNDLREDGDIELWASDLANYRLSFSTKIKSGKDELINSRIAFRESDPSGHGGAIDHDDTLFKETQTPSKHVGTMYYIFSGEGKTKERTRILSPWDLSKTKEVFSYEWVDEVIKIDGLIVINMGKIKEEINRGIQSTGP